MVRNLLPYTDVLIKMLIISDNIYIYEVFSVVDGKLRFVNNESIFIIFNLNIDISFLFYWFAIPFTDHDPPSFL